jgi:hypothetical protein
VTQAFFVAPNSNTGAAATFIADSVGRGILVANQAKTVIAAISVSSNVAVGTNSNTPLVFITNAAECARISSDGTFRVKGAGTAGSTDAFQVSGSAPADAARIDSSGRLLVGTATATGGDTVNIQGRDVAGNQYCLFAQADTTGTAYAMRIYSTTAAAVVGSITFTGSATAYNTSSDYRLKDNQQPLTNSGAFIDALKPKTWNWRADGRKGVGFIAHEVQAVSPSSVVGEKDAVDADGNPVMQAMEYGSAEFIANIVAEIQSLRARVAALEA